MAEEKNLYDENFYRLIKDGSYQSATQVLPIVKKFFRPQSVIDVGCSVGTWLAVWKQLGAEIFGVDGDYVDRSQLFIKEKYFHPANLEERIKLNQKFDLVQTLEVAEHLTPERADSFVEDLTKLGDVILFSAAIPGQSGTNHINEQWQSYWAEKFLRHNYVCIDCIRSQIWNVNQIEIHYRQNIFIYAKSSELYRYPELQKFYLEHRDNTNTDLVHPQHYFWRLSQLQELFNQFQNLKNQYPQGGGFWRKIILDFKKIFRRKPIFPTSIRHQKFSRHQEIFHRQKLLQFCLEVLPLWKVRCKML